MHRLLHRIPLFKAKAAEEAVKTGSGAQRGHNLALAKTIKKTGSADLGRVL